MGKDKKNISSSERVFFLGYGIWLLWRLSLLSVLSFPEDSIENTLIHFISLLVLMLSLAISVFFEKEPITIRWIPSLALLALGIAQELLIDASLFIDLAVLFLSADRRDFRSIAKFTLWVEGIGCAVIVTSSLIGLIPNVHITRFDGTIRYYLGFNYCTFLSHLFLNMVLLVLCLRREKIQYREIAAFVAIDIVIFALTDARNSFALVLFSLASAVVLKTRKGDAREKIGKAIQRGAWAAFIVFPLISLLVTVAYDSQSPAWQSANSVLSNRIAQTSASFERYGCTLLGQDIQFVGNGLVIGGGKTTDAEAHPDGDHNYVDNSYMLSLINNGIIATLVFLWAFVCASKRAINDNDSWLSLALLMIAIHSLFDPQLLQLVYNTFLFIVWDGFLDYLPHHPNRCYEKEK